MTEPYIEIENKYRVSDSLFQNIKIKLQEINEISDEEIHLDVYYTPESDDFLKEKYPYKWLSIRERNGIAYLNFKHFFPEGAEKHTHCNEYTTEVGKIEILDGILSELGISRRVEIRKKRSLCRIGNFEICLDAVDNLGFFVEIETTGPAGCAGQIKDEITSFGLKFGLKEDMIDRRGYPFIALFGD